MKNYFDEKARINNYIYIYRFIPCIFELNSNELEYLNYGGIGGPAQ